MNRQIGPQINSSAKTAGTRFGKVFAYSSMSPLKAIGAAAVGLFAVQKVKQFFSGAIDEARESQKVSALTAQVIKSTGGAAGISAKQVGNLANSISLLTGIDDEAVQGAENLLLTFTNLRNEAGKGNDVFNQATKIVTDMSVALDQDLKSSSIQVGKALNDPIKGITALSRVGVSFTQQQKDQIAALVASGNTLKAQKVILGELGREFGGAAAAAATSGDKFKTAFANLQESVGLALLPLLDKLLDKGTVLINWMIANVPPAFAAFKAAVMPVVTVLQDLIANHLEAFKTALAALGGSALTSVIALIGGGLVSAIAVLVGALASPIALVGALAGAAVYAYVHFEQFRTSVNQLAAWIQTNAIPALIQFGQALRVNVLPILQSAGQFLVTQFYPAMIQFWATVVQKLLPALRQLVASFRADLLPALQQAAAKFKEWQPTLQQVAAVLLKVQLANDKLGASVLGKALPPIIKLTAYMAGTQIQTLTRIASGIASVIGFLGRLGGAFGNAGQAAARFTAAVKQRMSEAVAFVGTVPEKIKGALGDLSNTLYPAGRAVIGGLIKGITDRTVDIIGAVSPIAGIIAAHKGPIAKDRVLLVPHGRAIIDGLIAGVRSRITPLAKTMDDLTGKIGKWTMEGIENGIKAGGPKVLDAMKSALDKTLDRVQSFRDNLKSKLDGVLSDFSSLKDSIASTFAGDLFSVSAIAESLTDTTFFAAQTVGQVFDQNLMNTKTHLKQLLRAFKKLKHWGLPSQFLSQLFASGNSDLILEMASGTQSHALADASLFGDVQSLSNQLGGQVARNQYGPQIKRLEDRLTEANRHLKHLDDLDKRLARAINASVSHGQKKAS
ncbi:phage tail protein [Nocardioides sp. URHA0032]|uniref:phage tail protein n=1 Tax=Nocardioides sp. URHA0032 TaxID=1380388 RepID=UPI00048FB812|nr:hypothetical protein [Nocardioides sp. URHA0032]